MKAWAFVRSPRRLFLCLSLLSAVLVVSGEAGAVGAHGRAWLGIVMLSGAGDRVSVKHVFEGSPAARTGLRRGDRLLAVDGRTVISPRDVIERVAELQPGDPCQLQIERGAKKSDHRVTLGIYPGRGPLLREPHIGRSAPEISQLLPVQGELPVRLGAWRGQVVLVAFWATWCDACAAMLPQLDAWQDRYGKRGLQVLGISSDDVPRTRLAIERWSLRHPVAVDPTERTFSAFGAYLVPAVYVIDRKGVIREVLMSYDPAQRGQSEKLIEKLLGER